MMIYGSLREISNAVHLQTNMTATVLILDMWKRFSSSREADSVWAAALNPYLTKLQGTLWNSILRE